MSPPALFRCVAALAFLGVTARSAPALSQANAGGKGEKVRLEYRAPAACPPSAEFFERVRARSTTGWEARPGEAARPLLVEITEGDGRFLATLDFPDGAGGSVERTVAGRSCDEVVSGIALVAALAIRSRVGAGAGEPAAGGAEPAPPTAGPAPAAAAPVPRRRALRWRAGATGSVLSGVGPSAAFGAGGFAGAEGSHWYAGLSGHWAASGVVAANGVDSEFQLLAARLEACPVRLQFGRRAALEPCALFEAGALEAEAREAPPQVTAGYAGSAPWAAPGALARLLFKLDPLLAEVQAIARVPLVHQEFYVTDGAERVTVFEVPWLSFGASLGLGVHF